MEGKFWANFCHAVGRPDWPARQWEPLPQQALIADVAALMRTRTGADWARDLAEVDCCAQLVLEPAEVIADAQVRARGLVAATPAPDARVEVLYPARFDAAAPAPRRPLAEADAETLIRAWRDR